jgi:hypothetical protein
LLIYCYFRKVSTIEKEAETSRKRLAEAKGENAKLKEVVARMEELCVLGQHSAMMECEASDTSKARDRVEAELVKLSNEFKGLQAEHAKLREDHSVL